MSPPELKSSTRSQTTPGSGTSDPATSSDAERGSSPLRSRRDVLGGIAAAVSVFALPACNGAGGTPETPPGLTPPAATGRSYSTQFDSTEYPISENGAWTNNGTLWTKVRTADGLAFGSNGANETYDDSYAYLSGFPPNQQVEAVVQVSPALTGSPHEVELLLRWADATTQARGYECLFNFQGGVQIMRWNGPFGDFTEIQGTGPGGLGRRLVSGDVIGAEVVGSTISVFINGTRRLQATDSKWAEGQPGIGFFKRTAGLNSDFALTSFSARAL